MDTSESLWKTALLSPADQHLAVREHCTLDVILNRHVAVAQVMEHTHYREDTEYSRPVRGAREHYAAQARVARELVARQEVLEMESYPGRRHDKQSTQHP